MGEVIRFVPKSERERARLIREARAIYDSVFPPSDSVREQRDRASQAIFASAQTFIAARGPIMIAIIAVLCSLSSPANCHEQTVTTSDSLTSRCSPA